MAVVETLEPHTLRAAMDRIDARLRQAELESGALHAEILQADDTAEAIQRYERGVAFESGLRMAQYLVAEMIRATLPEL